MSDIPGWAWLVAGATVVYVLYTNRDKFNPTSDKNLASQAANQTTDVLTGGHESTFGGWLYDVTHPWNMYTVTTWNTSTGNAVEVTRMSDNAKFSVDSTGFFTTESSLYHVNSDGTISLVL